MFVGFAAIEIDVSLRLVVLFFYLYVCVCVCVCGIYLPSLFSSFEIALCLPLYINIRTLVIDTHAFAHRFISYFFTLGSSHDV
jgi:hypothetical protein